MYRWLPAGERKTCISRLLSLSCWGEDLCYKEEVDNQPSQIGEESDMTLIIGRMGSRDGGGVTAGDSVKRNGCGVIKGCVHLAWEPKIYGRGEKRSRESNLMTLNMVDGGQRESARAREEGW